jgi:hypothetical protein
LLELLALADLAGELADLLQPLDLVGADDL